ncbi:MAG: outer membrane protein assembly factor BamD [Deltaproteobacteria bacterium]|nr:outer membrane protein assembly factor BamD [Deltaproteobacteria bacterium]
MRKLQKGSSFSIFSIFTVAAVSAFLCGSCASLGLGGSEHDVTVTYGKEVLDNYKKGMEELWDESYLEANKYFEHVRNNFQFSKYAALAELRIADSDFGRGKFNEASDEYLLFRKFHPNHPAAPYAAYKAALCFYKQMPEKWFFLPPPEERDQAPIKQAYRYLKQYLDEYGFLEKDPRGQKKAKPDKKGNYDIMIGEEQRKSDAERIADARKKLAEVRRKLADHEMYVAKFYKRHDKPKAVVARLNNLLANYSGLGLDVEALEMLAETYIELGDKANARKTYERLVANHPKAPEADDARKFLKTGE